MTNEELQKSFAAAKVELNRAIQLLQSIKDENRTRFGEASRRVLRERKQNVTVHIEEMKGNEFNHFDVMGISLNCKICKFCYELPPDSKSQGYDFHGLLKDLISFLDSHKDCSTH